MNYFKWLLAGVVGAAVGAVIWVFVGHAMNMEVGYIAWGLGALAGIAVRKVAGAEEGAGPGVAALITAVFGIAIAKYEVVALNVDNMVQGMVARIPAPTEEEQISLLADEIIEKLMAEKEKIDWPVGDGNEDVVTEADYPPGIWKDAKARWTGMTEAEKTQRAQQRELAIAARAVDLKEQLKQQAFQASFGPYDLLWFGLAAATAYRIGRGREEHAASAEVPSDPAGIPEPPAGPPPV